MTRSNAISFCALVILFAGCAENGDSLMRRQIALMNETADALENNASPAKISEIQKRGQALAKDFEKLKLSAEEKLRLIEKHQKEFEKANGRLIAAAMKYGRDKSGAVMPSFGEMFK